MRGFLTHWGIRDDYTLELRKQHVLYVFFLYASVILESPSVKLMCVEENQVGLKNDPQEDSSILLSC